MTTFLLNRETVTLASNDPDLTALEFLRQQAGLRGTKEGCASGDCGACTIVVGERSEQGIRYRTLNSCITFIHSLHGKQILTVEHLENSGELHPVQQAMVRHHGSQCGFCTPGFIMSLYALYHSDASPKRESVLSALSGNLCRCTGYRPIIDAGLELLHNRHDDAFDRERHAIAQRLDELAATALPEATTTDPSVGFWQPRSREELAATVKFAPKAHFSAGSTDLALEKTQRVQSLDGLIDLNQVDELLRITADADGIHIGAAVSYTDLASTLLADYPEAEEWLERLGSRPIRNRGTLGGNLANASPIGDTPPLLIALGAEVSLHDGTTERRLAVADLITGYRQTQLKPGEWIDTLHIPRRIAGSELAVYKISKRFEDDISTVCAAFHLERHQGRVHRFRAAFGGLAATPLVLPAWQAALVGADWATLDVDTHAAQLASQLKPIDDVRASARYRISVTANLFRRFHLQTTDAGIPTRAFHTGETHHA